MNVVDIFVHVLIRYVDHIRKLVHLIRSETSKLNRYEPILFDSRNLFTSKLDSTNVRKR